MRTILCFFAISAFVAYVKAEPCTQTSDCHYETCTGTDWHLACERGTCTCTHTGGGSGACTSDADCGQNHQCPFGLRWRCSTQDHNCHCRRN